MASGLHESAKYRLALLWVGGGGGAGPESSAPSRLLLQGRHVRIIKDFWPSAFPEEARRLQEKQPW